MAIRLPMHDVVRCARKKVVDAYHVDTAVEQHIAQVGGDESATSGDDGAAERRSAR
ncbi:hypothetical protein SCAB_21401 [Streptomyces scabiei 87.22]|uniref:Uncharacterized protein n=1 Tax=Streptomyces scabiei (strain 87.22) TaxID=680198 RepID=C9YW16_STRSW|nr:hypothetical protein SCAB_21401 [Streptomyces scabiei 87.22]